MNDIKKIKLKVNQKKKKISFISAILIVIGSCIGSGIYLKSDSVLSNAWYSLPLALASWVIAAIGVICLSLSLIEICSSDKNNLSIIGWVKNFTNKYIYKACKNFVFYLSTPIAFFFYPIYTLSFIQDALVGFNLNNNFNTEYDFLIWATFALILSFWFIFVSGMNTKFGNIQNWIITIVKFLPLLVITILGFYIASNSNSSIIITPTKTETIKNLYSFKSFSPTIGMFLSFAAIFFAYDGFYYANGIQTEMINPKKAPISQLLGILITTIVYIIISTAMTIAYPSNGSFYSFQEFLISKNLGWLFGLINILIAFGILGVVNALAMWSSKFTEDLIKENQLPFSNKFKHKLNPKNTKIGSFYVATMALVVFVIFTLIGGLGYVPYGYIDNSNQLSLYDGVGYYSMAKLIAFADLMSNWTAVLIFGFLVLAIIGGLINRKTKKIKVKQTNYFIFCAVTATLIVGLALIFQFIAPFVDLIMIFIPKIKSQLTYEDFISRIMLIIVFIIFLILMIIPTYFDPKTNKIEKKNITIHSKTT